jgi:diamine N-acetyltransferase
MRNPVLAGERVYLRPFEPADGDMFAEIDAIEDDLHIDDGPRSGFSTMATRKWVERFTGDALPGRIQFAVCLKENDYCIGLVGLGDLDWVHRTASTFALFRPGEYRGRGYGTESKHLVMEFAFEHLGLHSLVSWIWERNERSIAAILKQGYRPAGRLKHEAMNQGRYYDVCLFDLLREDWESARATWQASRARPQPESSGGT